MNGFSHKGDELRRPTHNGHRRRGIDLPSTRLDKHDRAVKEARLAIEAPHISTQEELDDVFKQDPSKRDIYFNTYQSVLNSV